MRKKKEEGHILEWQHDADGRPFVILYKDGVGKKFYKSDIKWMHEHQAQIPEDCVVIHRDGDFENFAVENLLLVTVEDFHKLYHKAVVGADENGNMIRLNCPMEGVKFGYDPYTLLCAVEGRWDDPDAFFDE